jgi:unsaturated rhamnogalacturonyl hydrolase
MQTPSVRILMSMFVSLSILIFALSSPQALSQPPQRMTDANTALHALQPEYPVPYGVPTMQDVKKVLDCVYSYLDAATPTRLINSNTGEEITDLAKIEEHVIPQPGDFKLISYEWGVTYAGMLLAGEVTGDSTFTNYTAKRLQFIADVVPHYQKFVNARWPFGNPFRQIIDPRTLDDAGSMCAAMIKAERAGLVHGLRPVIDRLIDHVHNKQFRLQDGTLARNRPQKNTLWLDDLFMSVPALAQMGKLTGEREYYDDAVKQVLQFSDRMFVKEKGLYMHGWVQDMEEHPAFHWARANGWAIMAIIELLEVLPEDHPGRQAVLDLLRAHIRGLAACQSGTGFWHQLLDRSDSYLETSATAIYTYCIARAINRGYIDPLAYSPVALLAWNAVTTKVNEKGQVEGTCVGTGMAFDPAFYYHRPINVFAAHGYGPTLLAGAEIIAMLQKSSFGMNDSSVQYRK